MNFPFSPSRELLPQEPRQPPSQDRVPPARFRLLSSVGVHWGQPLGPAWYVWQWSCPLSDPVAPIGQ